jgi:hypothetical protein
MRGIKMVEIEFINSNDTPIFVQVDPWACLYKLDKGQTIEILAPNSSEKNRFSIWECEPDTRILTLLDCEEFFVNLDGKAVHWKEYPTNLPQQQ